MLLLKYSPAYTSEMNLLNQRVRKNPSLNHPNSSTAQEASAAGNADVAALVPNMQQGSGDGETHGVECQAAP